MSETSALRATPARNEARQFSPAPPLLLILFLAFALRLWQLGAQSLWYDEAVSLFIAREPIPDLLAHTAGDIHPPVYYLLLHFWLDAAGDTEFAAAFFSLFFGVLLIALVYRLTRNVAGTHAGVIAALLVAFSSFNFWYSQEVRMYTLAACIAVLSVMLLAHLWALADQPRDGQYTLDAPFVLAALAYAVVVALGLYTHYYFIFLWIFEYALVTGALVLRTTARLAWRRDAQFIPRQRPAAKRSGLSGVKGGRLYSSALPSGALRSVFIPLLIWHSIQSLVLVLFAPWLPIAIRQATDPPVPPWRSFVAAPAALLESISALSFGQSLPIATGWPLVIVVGLLYVAGTLALWRGRTSKRITLTLCGATLAPLMLILLVSLRTPLYHVRYVFIYAAFFYAVLSLGVFALARRSLILAVVLLGVVVGGSLYSEYFRRFDAAFAKDDYRTAVNYIAARWRAGDALLINAGYIYPAFVYYYPGVIGWRGRLDDYQGDENDDALVVVQSGSLEASGDLGWGSPASDFYPSDERKTASALDLLFSKHNRVWVLRANDTVNDPDGFIRAYVAAHGLEFDEVTVRGESFVKVQGYVARSSHVALAPSNNVSVNFGGRVTLLGWSGAPTATAGGALPLALWWKGDAPLDVDYHASLTLYDATGKRWAATDGVPVGDRLPTGDWPPGQVLPADASLSVPLGTPPGDYSLQAALYDPLTTKSLPVPSGADGTRARLGVIQVVRAPEAVLAQSLPAGLMLTQPIFDNRLSLEQAQFTPSQIRPGQAIHAELLWHALSGPLDDAIVFFQLLDDKGRLWAAQESAPVDGRYPTAQWAAGEYVRDTRDLQVPADVPDGRFHVVVGLYRARDHERLTVRNGWWPLSNDALELGLVDVKGRAHVMRAPSNVGTPVRVRFGDAVLLVGHDLLAPSGPSRSLTLTLTWQALAPMSTSYKVFVHLVGDNEQIVAQRDSVPGDGELPTTGWIANEYLTDRYVLELPPSLAPGDYSLYVGFYDPQTTVRLGVFDADNRSAGDRWLLRKLALH